MNKFKYVGVRLLKKTDAQLHDISERRGIPVAVLIRSVIMEWIEHNPAVDARVPIKTSTTGTHRTLEGADASDTLD